MNAVSAVKDIHTWPRRLSAQKYCNESLPTMRGNRLRELLAADQPSLGTRILSSWPTIIELVGHSGMFDYVEFCGADGDFEGLQWFAVDRPLWKTACRSG